MDTTQATKNGIANAKKTIENGLEAAEERVENVETALQERVDQASDLVEELRDRAEMMLHERPYLLPVATGALGLGIGVLIGSKISRVLLLTAAGALMSDTVRAQAIKIGKDLLKNVVESEDEGEDVDSSYAEG